ncbi:hypothetical protein C4D60_Mb01t05660 [Musa balbisiana]|uniref:Inositol-tetrakisphosphate 1-kinase n=1 Tax=Musa balbisiana TaxID=52838 RepID=A0A4V4H750_MUSBA|nr:hypothetical protein C4D60_Mb01t05660 [Musa balbisiana]
MRLIGEISYVRNEEDKENEGVPPMSLPPPPQQTLVVGYALTSKKVKSFFQPKLEALARKKGIVFVAIDQSQLLLDQGPFDIILHKLTGKEWQQVLEDYMENHPEVTVLDPPAAIQRLYNRQSMLQDVADLNLSNCYGRVGTPRQLVITKDSSSIPDAVSRAGLALPLGEACVPRGSCSLAMFGIARYGRYIPVRRHTVAKPLVVDGSAKSHELSLAYDEFSLSKLDPPFVLQEFINHGGVLFKVYIVGEAIKVVRRFSLPDVSKRELLSSTGVFQFPRVSCAAASADDADLDPSIAELPPRPLLEKLARELRRRLGLRLFNIDIIREHGTRDGFYVIDINYFPGKWSYSKMPGYDHIFIDFLASMARSKYKKRLSSSN